MKGPIASHSPNRFDERQVDGRELCYPEDVRMDLTRATLGGVDVAGTLLLWLADSSPPCGLLASSTYGIGDPLVRRVLPLASRQRA